MYINIGDPLSPLANHWLNSSPAPPPWLPRTCPSPWALVPPVMHPAYRYYRSEQGASLRYEWLSHMREVMLPTLYWPSIVVSYVSLLS